MAENQYREEVLKSLETRCRELKIPFEASESDTAVRLFNRRMKAEQALASRKAAESAAESAKTAKTSVWAAWIAAVCAIISLIILLIKAWQ